MAFPAGEFQVSGSKFQVVDEAMKQAGFINQVGRYIFGYDAVESRNKRQAPTGRRS